MSKAAPNIYQKLSAIRSEIGALKKDGTNAHFKYHYVTEAQVMEHLKELCGKHGVFITIDCTKVDVVGDITTAWIKYEIIDIDNPENRFAVTIPGTGKGTDDKSLYKAYTGSYKYFAVKTFQLATDTDPENDSKDKVPYQNGSASVRPANQLRQAPPPYPADGAYDEDESQEVNEIYRYRTPYDQRERWAPVYKDHGFKYNKDLKCFEGQQPIEELSSFAVIR